MKEFVEKLIALLKDEKHDYVMRWKWKGEHEEDWEGAEAMQKAIGIVERLAEEHNNGWISVSDALPEDNQCPVLACTRNDVMYTAVYDAVYDKWYDDNFEREIFITDWQPLPQTPRRGE